MSRSRRNQPKEPPTGLHKSCRIIYQREIGEVVSRIDQESKKTLPQSERAELAQFLRKWATSFDQ